MEVLKIIERNGHKYADYKCEFCGKTSIHNFYKDELLMSLWCRWCNYATKCKNCKYLGFRCKECIRLMYFEPKK